MKNLERLLLSSNLSHWISLRACVFQTHRSPYLCQTYYWNHRDNITSSRSLGVIGDQLVDLQQQVTLKAWGRNHMSGKLRLLKLTSFDIFRYEASSRHRPYLNHIHVLSCPLFSKLFVLEFLKPFVTICFDLLWLTSFIG